MNPVVKRATISDVARQAGVSKQTVSRVINQSPLVSEATRKQVQAIIDRLGYRRSELARTLTCGRSYTIAVVGNAEKFFSADWYAGFARIADDHGYALILKEMLRTADQNTAMGVIHSLLDHQVDGILWAIPESGAECPWLTADFLRQITVPVVFMNAAPRPGLCSVGYDNYAGATLAMRHLIALGRRHIAHISGPLEIWIAAERQRAWLETLHDAGLSHGSNQLFEGDWFPASGQKALAHLLDDFPEMDAVFVAGDYMCLGVFLEAQRRGIRIPEDLAVIGFGNRFGSDCYFPPLTTVDQNKPKLGEAAFQALVEQIGLHFGEEKKSDSPIALQHELLIRDSAP